MSLTSLIGGATTSLLRVPSILLVTGTLFIAVPSQGYQQSCYDCLYGNFLIETSASQCEEGYEYRVEMEDCSKPVSEGCWSVHILKKELDEPDYQAREFGGCLETRIYDCFRELAHYPAYLPRGVSCTPKVYTSLEKETTLTTECPKPEGEGAPSEDEDSTTPETPENVTYRICPCSGSPCANQVPNLLQDDRLRTGTDPSTTTTKKSTPRYTHSRGKAPPRRGGYLSFGGIVAFIGLFFRLLTFSNNLIM